MFGIDDKILMDRNFIKVLNGIAGSGKSTATVNDLTRLGSNFCLASFSNALKFAASDKFGCPVNTICGLEFINTPFPRYAEKEVTEYDTVVNDEILLDGCECIEWMINNVGKINIIALTDSRQMLNADNGAAALKAFSELCERPDVVCVDIDKTRRARDPETLKVYNKLYKTDSNELFDIKKAQKLLKCDIVNIEDVTFNENNVYLCHSNAIEHELYKMYNINDRKDIPLIPKNHISRLQKFDANKYPICDQITAESKNIDAYLQAANIATPTRFQGKEVEVGDECYFVVKENDVFTGREIYTVGTRCQSIKSIHIAIIKVKEYKDPELISGRRIVNAKHLNIKDHDKNFKCVSMSTMTKLLKTYGEEGQEYFADMILSGDNVIYTTMKSTDLMKFAKFEGDQVILNKVLHKTKKNIRSIAKKDPSMHFDFMQRVYEILKIDVTPPRINNPRCRKEDFSKYCDIWSAFPTILNFAEMPKAGYLYEEYDKDLMNFYIYKGDKITKCSLITEELAEYLGDSEYVFSTEKQQGCEIGRYTYAQCKQSKEKKKKINEEFIWGKLESDYYKLTDVVKNGEHSRLYVKHTTKNLELLSCALWSKLCLIMFKAVDSIGADKYIIATDGIYYNGDKDPVLPSWCDYRIEEKKWNEKKEDDGEKYHNIIKQSYDDPPATDEIKRAREKARRESMTEEQKEAKRERDRARRANMTDEQKAKEAERKRIARAKKKAEAAE